MELEGWGRYPRHESEALTVTAPAEVGPLLAAQSGLVARGNGRAYGDAAIGQRSTLIARQLDRMRAFDPSTGLLTAEAGVLLADILQTFVPRGFLPPVVPGTKFVTVGGMIAADIHGKNHHRDGGFGDHVSALTLVLPGGQTVVCSRHDNQALFEATIGGMGLTGVILEATFALKPIETAWIMQRTIVANDLSEALQALDASDQATYSVAWIDCLAKGPSMGRSLIYVGEHATGDQVRSKRDKRELFPRAGAGKISIPVDLPPWALNRHSVAAFNELYFRRGSAKSSEPFLVHWDPYFFPLDGIGGWNRMYGKSGFLQHQCVVPTKNAESVLGTILERFSQTGKASFLAVLKKLKAGSGLLSFPMDGYTLALDIQVADDVFPLLDEIDRIIVEAGGRLYLAKDARQSRRAFEAGYPGLAEFKATRRMIGAERRLASRLSTRLGI